ncbi:hypothetical protein Tco_0886940 [Tanacetum coccineum]
MVTLPSLMVACCLGFDKFLSWLLIQKMIHTVKIDEVRQIVDVESSGKSADEIDKETVSFGEMQLKQEDRSYIHASIKLHLRVVHVVPNNINMQHNIKNSILSNKGGDGDNIETEYDILPRDSTVTVVQPSISNEDESPLLKRSSLDDPRALLSRTNQQTVGTNISCNVELGSENLNITRFDMITTRTKYRTSFPLQNSLHQNTCRSIDR